MIESDQKTIFNIEAGFFNFVILIASLMFLYRFGKIEQKNYGLYMILVLNITDLGFVAVNFLSQLFQNDPEVSSFFAALGPPMFRFSLYWSASMAYFIYLVIYDQKLFSPKTFFFKSLIWCLLLSLGAFLITLCGAFGVKVIAIGGDVVIKMPLNNLSNQIGYFVVFLLFGTILPIVITFYFYFQVYKKIKETTGERSKYLLWYSAIQIFCFLPGCVFDTIYMFLNIETLPFLVILLSSICHRSWGFLNLMAYWFLRYTSNEKDETKHEEKNNDISSLYYSHDQSSIEII